MITYNFTSGSACSISMGESVLELSKGSDFIQFEDTEEGTKEAKKFRKSNIKFKGCRIHTAYLCDTIPLGKIGRINGISYPTLVE
jgi:hypothetical protein